MSGKYNTKHPLPEGSQRGDTYNPILPQLEKLTDAMRAIGEKYGASAAQVAIAWAIAKGTRPIIGVTKPSQVEDAVKAAQIALSASEMEQLEILAKEANVDTRGSWENPMV